MLVYLDSDTKIESVISEDYFKLIITTTEKFLFLSKFHSKATPKLFSKIKSNL